MIMSQRQALEVVAAQRGDRIVVATMSAVTLWPEFSNSPRDFFYQPSSMGQAPTLGLGLALARPERGVIVLNGDGCMLMNLGCLATLASYPADLYLLIFDNGLYEVTGGQPRVGAGRTDFALLARGAGIQRVYTFADLSHWQAGASEALSGPGPVVIWLKVEGKLGQKTPRAPHPLQFQIQRLQKELANSITR